MAVATDEEATTLLLLLTLSLFDSLLPIPLLLIQLPVLLPPTSSVAFLITSFCTATTSCLLNLLELSSRFRFTVVVVVVEINFSEDDGAVDFVAFKFDKTGVGCFDRNAVFIVTTLAELLLRSGFMLPVALVSNAAAAADFLVDTQAVVGRRVVVTAEERVVTANVGVIVVGAASINRNRLLHFAVGDADDDCSDLFSFSTRRDEVEATAVGDEEDETWQRSRRRRFAGGLFSKGTAACDFTATGCFTFSSTTTFGCRTFSTIFFGCSMHSSMESGAMLCCGGGVGTTPLEVISLI